MKNWRIGLKLGLGIGLILALIAVSGIYTVTSFRTIDSYMTEIETVSMPLAQSVGTALGALRDVPGAMNAYLRSGSQSSWKQVEESLNITTTELKNTRRLAGMAPEVPNELADQAQAQVMRFVAALRETYQGNEEFLKNRQEMIATGAKLQQAADSCLKRIEASLQHAHESQDLAAISRTSRETKMVNELLDTVNYLRLSMLRALAVQERAAAERGVAELFPRLFEQLKNAETILQTEQGRAELRPVQELAPVFRGLQTNMLKLWARTDELSTERDKTREAAFKAMTDIANIANKDRDKLLAETRRLTSSNVTASIGIVVMALLIGVLAGVALTRSITGPVGKTLEFAQAVAAGALDRRLHLNQNDEIGKLGEALDMMVDTLNHKIDEANQNSEAAALKEKEALRAMHQAEEAEKQAQRKTDAMLQAAVQLEEVVNIVSSASTQLSAQIVQSENGARHQAEVVTETATAMEEMNSTVMEVAKNAGDAAIVSARTRERADSGAGVVSKSVNSIRQVQQEALALKEDMTALGSQAQAINQIMGVISDIADQTNLLALNAAIEAARAGEAGRGFAVVADEVRKLAEKTMSSTSDVGNAIQAIQSSATKSMEQVDKAVRAIEEATTFANQSGEALKEIVTMADNTADQVRAIATAAEEQSASSDEINRSISNMSSIAGETSQAMAEAAVAVNDMATQAHRLTRLIEDLKKA